MMLATAAGTAEGRGETGIDETGMDETGIDETGMEETGIDETGIDETGAAPTATIGGIEDSRGSTTGITDSLTRVKSIEPTPPGSGEPEVKRLFLNAIAC